MTVEKYRDVLHNIIGEYYLYHGDKYQLLMFVSGYLNGVFECIICDKSMDCNDSGYLHLTREYEYIRNSIIGWLTEGLDVRAGIDRVGWNTRKMENEWWYRHGEH